VRVGRLVPGVAAVSVPLPVRPRAGRLDGRDADARASGRLQAEQEAPSRVTPASTYIFLLALFVLQDDGERLNFVRARYLKCSCFNFCDVAAATGSAYLIFLFNF
jgi:hypothetical protein